MERFTEQMVREFNEPVGREVLPLVFMLTYMATMFVCHLVWA